MQMLKSKEIFDLRKRKYRAISMNKRLAAMALNLFTLLLAFAGLILITVWTSSSGSFIYEMNLLGFILALTVIVAGLTFYFQQD